MFTNPVSTNNLLTETSQGGQQGLRTQPRYEIPGDLLDENG